MSPWGPFCAKFLPANSLYMCVCIKVSFQTLTEKNSKQNKRFIHSCVVQTNLK
jgi:hypothetical protein